MMGAIQLGRLAFPPVATALHIVTITSSRANCAGEIARIATFGCLGPRLWGSCGCWRGAIPTSSEGSTAVGDTLRPRPDSGMRNRVSGGSSVGGDAFSVEFTVNGAGKEGDGGDGGG